MYILCTYDKHKGRQNYVAPTKRLLNKFLADMYNLGPATAFPERWRIYDAKTIRSRGWCECSHPDAWQYINTVQEGTTEIMLGY